MALTLTSETGLKPIGYAVRLADGSLLGENTNAGEVMDIAAMKVGRTENDAHAFAVGDEAARGYSIVPLFTREQLPTSLKHIGYAVHAKDGEFERVGYTVGMTGSNEVSFIGVGPTKSDACALAWGSIDGNDFDLVPVYAGEPNTAQSNEPQSIAQQIIKPGACVFVDEIGVETHEGHVVRVSEIGCVVAKWGEVREEITATWDNIALRFNQDGSVRIFN